MIIDFAPRMILMYLLAIILLVLGFLFYFGVLLKEHEKRKIMGIILIIGGIIVTIIAIFTNFILSKLQNQISAFV